MGPSWLRSKTTQRASERQKLPPCAIAAGTQPGWGIHLPRVDPSPSPRNRPARLFAQNDASPTVLAAEGNSRLVQGSRSTHASIPQRGRRCEIGLAASRFRATPRAGQRNGRAGSFDLPVHPALQPAGPNLSCDCHVSLFPVSLLLPRSTQAYRQSRDIRKGFSSKFRGNGARSDLLSFGAMLYFSNTSTDKWMVQAAFKCKEGASWRANAAPLTVSALRARLAVSTIIISIGPQPARSLP